MLASGGTTVPNCMKYLKDNPAENGAGQTSSNSAISSTAEGNNATNAMMPKKERPPLDLEIPSYVTKIEDTKSGGKYLCNPCQSHCNSDIQLSQHLASKKHLEKVSGKKNPAPNVRGSGTDWRDGQYGSNNSAHTANIFCEVCKLNFSSQSVLQTHLSGSKHQRKVKSLEVLKALEETQSCFEYDLQSGEIRCTVCDVVFHSPQHLSRHIDSERHKEAERKRENGEEGGTPAKKHCARKTSSKPNQENSQVGSEVTSTTGNSSSGTTNVVQKERPPIDVPACVTKLEDTKAGGNYLCNPCQAHCNSDIQLTQHLSSKKHLDKVSGKKRAPVSVGGRGKGRGWRGRGGRGWAPTRVGSVTPNWEPLSISTVINSSTTNTSYNKKTLFPDPPPSSSYSDSYGLSSLSRSHASSSYASGRTSNVGRGGGGKGAGIGLPARTDPYARSYARASSRSVSSYPRAEVSSHPGSELLSYAKSEVASYPRSDLSSYPGTESYPSSNTLAQTESYSRSRYGADYSAGRLDEYNSYARGSAPVADYSSSGYGASHSLGHASGRAMPITYAQSLSQSFLPGAAILQ